MPDHEEIESTPEILEADVHAELEKLQDEVLGPDLDDLSPEQLQESVTLLNESALEFLQLQMKSENPETAARAKFQYEVFQELNGLMDEIHGLIEIENFDKAQEKATQFLESQIAKMEKMGLKSEFIDQAIREMQQLLNLYGDMLEQELVVADEKIELLSAFMDIIPFVGGGKMLVEAAKGQDMAGHKMGNGGRVLKAAEGGMWLTVDTVGAAVGAVTAGTGGAVVTGVKYALDVPDIVKLLSRGAAVLRVTKGIDKAKDGSKVLFNASRFFAKHPRLEFRATKILETSTDIRRLSALKVPVEAGVVWSEKKKTGEILRQLSQERRELMKSLEEAFEGKGA